MSLENNKSFSLSITNTEIEQNKNKDNSKNKFIELNRDMFTFNYVIGKGGFGKVWQVIYKKTQEKYALKEMSKTKIIDKKSQRFINNELNLLKKLRNDFIVNIYYAFQDKDNLYLVIDFLSGGDLRYHVSRYHAFSEEQTRFFISCIIQGLSHIHSNNIIHRDIKPENLVLDSKGYVRITDFGIAKENEKDNSKETSGTPGYISPEVLFKKNHSFSTDFFAVGVIGYEFMKGKRPFLGSKDEIKEKMKDKNYFEEKVKIKEDDKYYKKGWSGECIDFINSLLELNPKERLGSKFGIEELKEHQWLKYYMWEEIEQKKLDAPFIPDDDKDNFDKDYCEKGDIITEKTKKRYRKIISSTEYQSAFVNFYFNIEISNNNKKPFQKKKIYIDGNIDNKQLKTSRSNKNQVILNIKKFICDSSDENINNKETNNNEIIKEVIEDNFNQINSTNRMLLKKNNKIIQNKEINDYFIKKLIIKNSRKRPSIKNNNKGNNNYYSLSKRIPIKNNNIYLKNHNIFNNSNSNSDLNYKSENNIKQYNFLNININNIKNRNIFTNFNSPLTKRKKYDFKSNPSYKKIQTKNKVFNPNIKFKQTKTVFGPNCGIIKYKNKNIRDLFFKKVYNPFSNKLKKV